MFIATILARQPIIKGELKLMLIAVFHSNLHFEEEKKNERTRNRKKEL